MDTMLGPELLRGLRAVRARGGGASRRLTGTLQGELTDVRSGLICSRSSSISSAGSSSFHPGAAGSSEFRVAAGSRSFSASFFFILKASPPPLLYVCLEYINSSCKSRPFLTGSSAFQ